MKKIKLTQGQFALVDDDCFEYLNQWKWHARKSDSAFYASRDEYGKKIHMHRVVITAAADVFVDHKDGNGLNNQTSNLRICSNSQNQRNRKSINKYGYKGVNKNGEKYRAHIRMGEVEFISKGFDSVEEAAHAYDEKAKELFGEFAWLNFPAD